MPIELATYLAPPKVVQPQAKTRLNRGHWAAPLGGVFLQESAYGNMRDLVSNKIFYAQGAGCVSGLNRYGRYTGFGTSTGRVEMPLPGPGLQTGMTLIMGSSCNATANGRWLEFYTDSSLATGKARFYVGAGQFQFQLDPSLTWSATTTTPVSGTRYTIILLWSGGFSSGDVQMWINGVSQAITYSNSSSGSYPGTTWMTVGNRHDGIRPNDVKLDFLYIDLRARTAAECFSIANAPYQMLEGALQPMIGVMVSGGGTAYNVSLALGIVAATGGGAGLAATGSMTLGMAAGVSEAGNMSALTALALGLQAGLSDNAIALASSSLALGLGLAISSASIDQISGALSLSVVAGTGMNGGQDFTVNIPLGLIAGLQISGGKSYSDSLALGLALGQAVAVAISPYVASSERVLGVQADNRLLTIRIENRSLVIAVENRTINVKLE